MPPQVMLIAARSLSQAMDWSLVLMSQGIGAEIQQAETDSPWGLLVASEDYHNAVTAIRQYRFENRGWPWQKEVFRAGLLFDWGSLAWVILLILFYGLDAQLGLRGAGMMNKPPLPAANGGAFSPVFGCMRISLIWPLTPLSEPFFWD